MIGHSFCKRIVLQLPMFSPSDFNNAEWLIEWHPILVHSVCYVTSDFLPEAAQTIDQLYPYIIRFLQNIIVDPGGYGEGDLANLQFLMLLLWYAETVPALRCKYPRDVASVPSNNVKGVHRELRLL